MKTIIALCTFVLPAVLNSCMVRTVTTEGGEQLYSKPVHGTPWESNERRFQEVEATERPLGVYGQ